jgi:para-nitrobenzyl esterase
VRRRCARLPGDLPLPSAQAVAGGGYAHVPILMGTSHDETRYFTQGYAAATQQQHDQATGRLYGSLAPAIVQRYPWSAYPSPYTTAYGPRRGPH